MPATMSCIGTARVNHTLSHHVALLFFLVVVFTFAARPPANTFFSHFTCSSVEMLGSSMLPEDSSSQLAAVSSGLT